MNCTNNGFDSCVSGTWFPTLVGVTLIILIIILIVWTITKKDKE